MNVIPPTDAGRRASQRSAGFTLVELLVVIGIIAVLIAIVMPSLSQARRRANQTVCASNLHQMYVALQMYSTESRGWLFPVGAAKPNGQPSTYGSNYPPHERWPNMTALRVEASRHQPILYKDPTTGAMTPYTLDYAGWNALSLADQLAKYDAAPFTSPVLLCPEDRDAVAAHSYVLNQHLADERIRFGSTRLGSAHSTSNVVVAGEKNNFRGGGEPIPDYYMENDENFEQIVCEYRHGIKNGSNYLFMDGHVENRMRATIMGGLDPWDLDMDGNPNTPNPTPTPTPNG